MMFSAKREGESCSKIYMTLAFSMLLYMEGLTFVPDGGIQQRRLGCDRDLDLDSWPGSDSLLIMALFYFSLLLSFLSLSSETTTLVPMYSCVYTISKEYLS